MDELAKQGQWWWLLAVPVATGIFALVGSWWGSRLGRTTENRQWRRNEKLKAYSQFLSDLSPLSSQTLRMLVGNDLDAKHAYDRTRMNAFSSMLLVADKQVMKHAIELINLTKSAGHMLDDLPEKVVKDLGDKDMENLSKEELLDIVKDASLVEGERHIDLMFLEHAKMTHAMRKDLGLDLIWPA